MATATTSAGWQPTLPANPVTARPAGKIAAAIALACIGAHLPMLYSHLATHPGTVLLMLGLAVGCLPCVAHLWRAPTVRVWSATGGLAAAMLAAHLMLLLTMTHHQGDNESSTVSSVHHHHTATSMSGPMTHGPGDPLFLLTTGLALLQIALAGTVVTIARRRRT